MGVRFYDEALYNKIQHWVKDPNMRILKPDESTRLFEMKLDQTEDRPLSLPLISLSREKNIEILEGTKQSKTFGGFLYTNNEKISVPINVIPISLGYQLDIYTKGMIEADEYVRNFVFNFINYPKLIIEVPYNDFQIKHESTLYLDNAIIDNSDIKEHLFADQFVRFTLKLTINDAYLFSMPTNMTAQLDLGSSSDSGSGIIDIGSGLEVVDWNTGKTVEISPLI